MLKQTLACTALIASIFGSPIIASPAEYGTSDEAKAMLNRAIVAVKADVAGAIAKFNHNEPPFRDRDLFVFCFNGQDGRYTAHEAFVAWDARKFRDATGKPVGAEMYATAQEGRITTVAYTSPVPGSTELATKYAYVTRIGAQVCGVSAYRFAGRSSPTQ